MKLKCSLGLRLEIAAALFHVVLAEEDQLKEEQEIDLFDLEHKEHVQTVSNLTDDHITIFGRAKPSVDKTLVLKLHEVDYVLIIFLVACIVIGLSVYFIFERLITVRNEKQMLRAVAAKGRRASIAPASFTESYPKSPPRITVAQSSPESSTTNMTNMTSSESNNHLGSNYKESSNVSNPNISPSHSILFHNDGENNHHKHNNHHVSFTVGND